MRSECNNPVTIPSPWRFAQGVQAGRIALNTLEMRLHAIAILALRRDDLSTRLPSRYSLIRTALNVPCFVGLSPTSGEKSASPVIKSGVSNFPLHVNVPASRPMLPRRNSSGPENVTEVPSTRVHFASEALSAPQTFERGSWSCNVPLPSLCASKRTERWSSFANVISTFHLPIMLGVCA